MEASQLAEAVNDSLGRLRIGPADYVPSLTEPEGPSTAGGVQSLQHLRLVPQQAGFQTLVVGSTNQVAGTGELRSFDYVDSLYRQRFKRPVPLDPRAYAEFLKTARSLLEVMRLRVTIAAPPADLLLASHAPPAEVQRSLSPLIVVITAVVMGALLAMYVLSRL
jgi:translation initiation factor IF-2